MAFNFCFIDKNCDFSLFFDIYCHYSSFSRRRGQKTLFDKLLKNSHWPWSSYQLFDIINIRHFFEKLAVFLTFLKMFVIFWVFSALVEELPAFHISNILLKTCKFFNFFNIYCSYLVFSSPRSQKLSMRFDNRLLKNICSPWNGFQINIFISQILASFLAIFLNRKFF